MRIRILGVSGGGWGEREKMNFFWVFFTFHMILNNLKKEKENFFGSKLPETDYKKNKKTYVAFFPWCKNHIFLVSKTFLKVYLVILILIHEVWTEEMKLFALHISYSTKSWFILPFLSLLARIRIHIFFADPDPRSRSANLCGSVPETTLFCLGNDSYRGGEWLQGERNQLLIVTGLTPVEKFQLC